MSTVVGWVGAYTSKYQIAKFTEERRKALIECIRHRHYNFTHFNHEFIEYCAPLYEDKKLCVLTKQQFDEVMDEAYENISLGARLTPIDAIKREPKDGILFEKEKYEKEGEWDE